MKKIKIGQYNRHIVKSSRIYFPSDKDHTRLSYIEIRERDMPFQIILILNGYKSGSFIYTITRLMYPSNGQTYLRPEYDIDFKDFKEANEAFDKIIKNGVNHGYLCNRNNFYWS